jgi:hypothetical protein
LEAFPADVQLSADPDWASNGMRHHPVLPSYAGEQSHAVVRKLGGIFQEPDQRPQRVLYACARGFGLDVVGLVHLSPKEYPGVGHIRFAREVKGDQTCGVRLRMKSIELVEDSDGLLSCDSVQRHLFDISEQKSHNPLFSARFGISEGCAGVNQNLFDVGPMRSTRRT